MTQSSLDSEPSNVLEDTLNTEECPLLNTINLTKNFIANRALDQVNFELLPGEVHVLFGENGAGKSTLVSVLAGAIQPSSGEIKINQQAVTLKNVHEARELGISAVFQEFSLIPQMTVAENILLGAESTKKGFLQSKRDLDKVQEILNNFEFNVNPNTKVNQLSRAEQQMVEIAKAFRSELSVLILDEPTASLTDYETNHLFKLIEILKQKNVGIIYISHRIGEIREIGDRVTVLRDGKLIKVVDAKTTTDEELIELMTGRVIDQIFPSIKFEKSEMILETQDLTTTDHSVQNADISVCRGEIVGIAGLVGSGKSQFGQACFGAIPIQSGKINFKGTEINSSSIRQMLDNGMLYLPSDRRLEGLLMMRTAKKMYQLPL